MSCFSETTYINGLKLNTTDAGYHFKTTNVENTFLSRIGFP